MSQMQTSGYSSAEELDYLLTRAAAGGVADGDYGDITVSGSGTVMNLDLKLNQIDAPTGSVDFSQQQSLQFRIENRTSDPGSPAVGQIWLRTDL